MLKIVHTFYDMKSICFIEVELIKTGFVIQIHAVLVVIMYTRCYLYGYNFSDTQTCWSQGRRD